MDLWIIAVALFAVSAVLLIVAYFKKEDKENLTEELEDMSLELFQQNYDLKQRIASLEEKLDIVPNERPMSDRVTDLTQKYILTLFTDGISAEVISQQLHVSEASVQHIIDNYISEGIH